VATLAGWDRHNDPNRSVRSCWVSTTHYGLGRAIVHIHYRSGPWQFDRFGVPSGHWSSRSPAPFSRPARPRSASVKSAAASGVLCDAGLWCEARAGMRSVFDVQGTCVRIPDVCPAVVQQVCGCDKKTYGDECERSRAKVAKDSDGPCRVTVPPNINSSGRVFCPPRVRLHV
jgi:Kazal-type serine protease inhibitor domain